MIREVKREEIPECVSLIKKAFLTVADEFGFTDVSHLSKTFKKVKGQTPKNFVNSTLGKDLK